MAFDREGFYKEVGLRLNMQRKRRGLTQEEVASAIGVPRATYANVERGRQRVALDVIWKLGVHLGVSIEKLVPEPQLESPRAERLAETVSVGYVIPEHLRAMHVVPSALQPGHFVVKETGNPKPLTRPASQEASVKKAIPLAKHHKSEVVTHGRDGKIRNTDSYGNDPSPPRDKKQH